MELAKQVVSLDLAKRLKELGVKQESLLYWSDELIEIDTNERSFHVTMFPSSFETRPDGIRYATERYSAFTVAELGEMLPQYYFTRKHFGSGTKQWHWQVYSTTEEDMINGEIVVPEMHTSDTEADARAKMLIYLIENKLLTV